MTDNTYQAISKNGHISALADAHELRDAMQGHGLRYSELHEHVGDVDGGDTVWADDGTRFTLATTEVQVTIGWTIHAAANPDSLNHRYADESYVPFSDSYRLGQPQWSIRTVVRVPVGMEAWVICESAYAATNDPNEPDAGTVQAQLLAAIKATGYQGREAHYSLSVGDTVTVGATTYAVARFGWEEVA